VYNNLCNKKYNRSKSVQQIHTVYNQSTYQDTVRRVVHDLLNLISLEETEEGGVELEADRI